MTDEPQYERAVVGAWVRIEAWLGRHAPRSRRMLPPPAPEADIPEVERELDLAMPPGLKAFYRIHNGTGHPADFGWTPEPGTGVPAQGEGTVWLLPMRHAIPPVQHLPAWDEGPHTIGRPADPALRYLAFAATDRSGLYGLSADCTPGPGDGRIGTFEEAGIPEPGVWPSFTDWDGPVHPLDPALDARRVAVRRRCGRNITGCSGHRIVRSAVSSQQSAVSSQQSAVSGQRSAVSRFSRPSGCRSRPRGRCRRHLLR